MKRLFNIQAGEERLAFLLFAEMFLLGVGFNFVETSVFPLFLSQFDAGTLPYLYVINGTVVALLTTFYLRLGRRLPFTGQLLSLLGFIVVLVFAFWLALVLGGGRPVTFALPVLFQIVVNLGQVGFWTMTARLLTLRQSKRLFGPIGSGMWVAIVITGFLIPFIVRAIGTVNLLLISGAGFGGALALLLYITRVYGSALDVGDEPGASTAARELPIGTILKNRYVLLMFGLTLVAWLSFFFIDNIFFNRLGDRFPTQAEQSSFLGLYLAVLGIFTLINNFFLAGFIVNRYGVRAALFVLPLCLFAVTLAFTSVGLLAGIIPLLFWLATLNRVLDLGLLFSVDQTAQSILYQPLPAADRTRIQTIDNGIVRMVAVGSAGVLLLLLNRVLAFDVVQLGLVLLVIVIGWLLLVYFTAQAYPRALATALVRRRLTGVTLTLDDSVTLKVLKDALLDARPGPALYALGLLAAHRPEALADALPALLAHPAQAVRRETLRRVETLGLKAERLSWTAENDPDPVVRGAAWRALAAAADPQAEAVLLAQLDSPDPATWVEALIGLRRYGSVAARQRADELIGSLAQAADPQNRLLAVEVLQQPAGPADCRRLAPLLADPDDGVQRGALEAAGRLDCPDHWPSLVEAVARRPVQRAAVAALVARGQDVLPVVAAALRRDDLSMEARIGLLRVCGRVGGEEATRILLAAAQQPDDRVRAESLLGLSRIGYGATGEQAIAVIHQCINDEIAYAAQLLAGWRDYQDVPELDYPRRMLQSQFEAARDRVFLLLSYLYDREAMLGAREYLPTGHVDSQVKQSYILELLDLKLPAGLKAQVMPLIEELPVAERLRRLDNLFDLPPLSAAARIETFLRGDGYTNRWLQAGSLYAAKRLPNAGRTLEKSIAPYLNHPDPLLRETAIWALADIGNGRTTHRPASGEHPMLSTIEKVIILKDVDLFTTTPDDLLAEVAGLLTEVEMAPGQRVFAKGQTGDSLYIIVSGRVRVHDGDNTINVLGESEVFGEMALLDPEPRMADVTAESDALLLRLDQGPFYDLMETRSEVARGIIRVLSNRLRRRVQEVSALRSKAGAMN